MRKGICVAGNMLVDILYPVTAFPQQGELVHIHDGISRAIGGAVCNVGVDLAKLDPEMKISALGRVGTDAEGELMLREMGKYPNIDLSNVIADGISSFTLVINNTVQSQRTFFTYLGASGRFSEADIDWDRLDCDILHVGYILLLDALDQADEECGSTMAHLLRTAQQHGIRTSIDVVTEASDRFKRLVPPALKYTDYCVINESEAEETTGVPLRGADGTLLRENMPAALKRMKELGVSTWAVIHCPEGGFGLDADNEYVALDSLRLPKGYIKGTVGAGDAFCAGVLYGAEKEMSLADSIKLGVASAAASLSEMNATDGMRSEAEVRALYEQYHS